MKNVKGFVEELNKLTNNYGLHLDSCGCCNSIMICENENSKVVGDMLTYNNEEYDYRGDI